MRMPVLAAALLAAILPAEAAGPAPSFAALRSMQPGQWMLSSRDGGFANRSICLGDPSTLLHLRHRAAGCSRYVIENEPRSTTVHYTCPGAGHGRTTVRLETPRLAQIQSQGVADGSPFDVAIEARWTRRCS